jgi:hypothetical protein
MGGGRLSAGHEAAPHRQKWAAASNTQGVRPGRFHALQHLVEGCFVSFKDQPSQ